MVRTARAFWRIAVLRHHERRVQCRDALHACVEIVDLKPQQNSVAVRLVGGVADGAMVVLNFESM